MVLVEISDSKQHDGKKEVRCARYLVKTANPKACRPWRHSWRLDRLRSLVELIAEPQLEVNVSTTELAANANALFRILSMIPNTIRPRSCMQALPHWVYSSHLNILIGWVLCVSVSHSVTSQTPDLNRAPASPN